MNKEDISTNISDAPDVKSDNTDDNRAFQLELEGQIKLLTRELNESQRDIILKLTKIVAERSRETGSHIQRVADLSYFLAIKAGLSKDQAEVLKLASPMHDVGKVSIPDEILHKPGPLSDEEFEIMQTHTTAGYEMLKGSRRKVLQTAAIIALQHHEKYNGKGYPLGLKGEKINILGRITQIADVFDALCSNRVYRPAWDIEKVLEHFRKHRGEDYDPQLVDILLDNVEKFLALRERYPDKQNNEHLAIVNWKNKNTPHPTVIRPGRKWSTAKNKPETVLICHDDGAVSEKLQTILGECGYAANMVTDYTEAWKLLKNNNSPRICVLDLDQDPKRSIKICKKIRRLGGNHYTYIIMLANACGHDYLSQAKEAGADTWVSTPLNDDAVKSCMSAAQRIIDLQDELICARETMRKQATRDQLTGIWNRHAILDILAAELSRASRENTSVGLVMVDIDQFKLVNDTYGHKAGDIVLRETAQCIQNAIRPYDGFARYGGEEFLLILPRCDIAFASYVAERLRKAVCSHPIRIDDNEISVTVSAGVTSMCGIDQTHADDLIQHADDALYLAKTSGRNCVMSTEKLNQAI